ncbi:MAG: hypothetical protein HC921_22395 [Synechococcaceae cyanobacterium SM2_3_1]|nr:hypothetical protein [Synechococcaceae cyanobacterium SM2_3_1]
MVTFFGSSVIISSTSLLVGSVARGSVGEAYLFNRDTGGITKVINYPGQLSNDRFAWGLASNDNLIAISSTEAVHMYSSTNGNFIRSVSAPTGSSGFGISLNLSDQYLIVGSALKGVNETVYLYNSSTGLLLQTIPDEYPGKTDAFGGTVAVSDKYIMVGAPGANNNKGAVYLFDINTGEKYTINSPGGDGAYFGTSLHIRENYSIIGSSGDGKAYVYQLP